MNDYILQPLYALTRAVSLLTVCSFMSMLTVQLASADTIMTPLGALRLGMTKDQVVQLLHSEGKEGGDPEGFFQPRTVNAKFNNRTVSALLTSKGTAYSISSEESFPADLVGKQAAEAAFQRYVETYAGPDQPPNFRTSEATIRGWTNSEGQLVRVVLMCDETELIVEIIDYERQMADDGKSDKIRQSFREYAPYGNGRCF